jgi:hypothetical protein
MTRTRTSAPGGRRKTTASRSKPSARTASATKQAAANQTKPTTASVQAFMARIADPQQRSDARALDRLMRRATKSRPTMWGSSILGYGRYHYAYASGREGDWCATGFAPRKGSLTVYVMAGLASQKANLARLGPHTTGVSCLYLKRLSDVKLPVLEQIVKRGLRDLRQWAPSVSR